MPIGPSIYVGLNSKVRRLQDHLKGLDQALDARYQETNQHSQIRQKPVSDDTPQRHLPCQHAQAGGSGMPCLWGPFSRSGSTSPCLRCWRQWIRPPTSSTNSSIGRSSTSVPSQSKKTLLCRHHRLWLRYRSPQAGADFQTDRRGRPGQCGQLALLAPERAGRQ